MRAPFVVFLALTFAVSASGLVPDQGSQGAPATLKVEPNRENVAAGRLDGRWVPVSELCSRLGSKPHPPQLVFKSEKAPAFLERISPAMAKQLSRYGSIYLGGTMQWGDGDHPFVLAAANGNPHLFMFREYGGDPLGDAESCNIALVPAQDPNHDLLFVGGDVASEPVRAFQRAPEAAK